MNQNNLPENNQSDAPSRAVRRRPIDKDKSEIGFNNLMFLLYFPVSFVYLEFVLHLSAFRQMSTSFFVYSLFFGLSAGLLTAVCCSFLGRKVNYWVSIAVLGFVSLYFGVQLVYNAFFKDFFYWGLMEVGANVGEFWENTVRVIWQQIIPILLIFLPPVGFALLGRKALKPLPLSLTYKIAGVALSVVLFFGGKAFVNSHNDEIGDKYFYGEGFIMSEAATRFGVLTAFRLDTQYTLFGNNSAGETEITTGEATTYDWSNLFGTTTAERTTPNTPADVTTPGSPETGTDVPGSDTQSGEPTTQVITTEEITTEPPKPLDTSPNVMDIDFDVLIKNAKTTEEKNAHTWFSVREPTLKNEYTGMFEGKNLIFMTVESWSPAAIDPVMTPTLYKMKTEGFVFDNYFCSNWGGSTNTGEYALLTGNFYNTLALWTSSKTLQPFTLGNELGRVGYKCYAFHNNGYNYYGREDSHPNYGYQWFGLQTVGGDNTTMLKRKNAEGVQVYYGTKGWDAELTAVWPASDYEMAKNTLSFIPTDGSNFHIYYMTVSGHPHQTWGGNAQSKAHRAEIAAMNLPYTDDYALSYLASQYEVELMVKALVDDLEAKGLLEDTVFVMAPDHYPYDISGNDANNSVTLSQLYNLPKENIFTNYNLYRAPLVIWSASMKEPVKVSKVCSAIDVLPTVLNLFGLEYDSRIIMGRDIMSTAEGFVIMNMSNGAGDVGSSMNWITDYGYYSSGSKTFTPFEGVSVDPAALKASGYLSVHTTLVTDMYKYSKYMLKDTKGNISNYYGKVFPNGIK